jgi:hypothetical protein
MDRHRPKLCSVTVTENVRLGLRRLNFARPHTKLGGMLEDLAIVTDAQSRRSASWDRTGGNIDCLTAFAPGETAALLETAGPGKVTHIWITMMEFPCHATPLRDIVLRMYWDGAVVPSVEVPIGDFFGEGHALPPPFYDKRRYTVVSVPVVVGTNERAFNCYWPMPFHRSARIEIFNAGEHSLKQFYYHVDYELGPQPEGTALFHAEFRQAMNLTGQVTSDDYVNLEGKDNYVLFETEGRGHYAGCFLYVDTEPGGWWGEGDDMIFIDHDTLPTITGTGSEDYFNNAWTFHHAFTFPWYGCPLLAPRADGGVYTNLYRFHGPDPVRFQSHIRVTIERWWETCKTNNLSSVAFWYQTEPAAAREPLPVGAANHPVLRQLQRDEYRHPAGAGVDVVALEVSLRSAGIETRVIAVLGPEFLGEGAISVRSDGQTVPLLIPVAEDGLHRVELKPVYGLIEGEAQYRVAGGEWISVASRKFRRECDGPAILLGEVRAQDGAIDLEVRGPGAVPVHEVRVKRID